MAGLSDWFPIFRTGRHRSASGETRTFTASDLDQIASRYDGAQAPSPCVITHEELYSPFAYAQVAEVRRTGDVLEARCDPQTVEPQFSRLVEAGRLANRSVQLLPAAEGDGGGWKLGHVAFLGADPPAVEGLAPIRFAAAGLVFGSDGPWDAVEVASRWAEMAAALRRLARRLLPAEEADEVVPEWTVRAADQAVGEERAEARRQEPGMTTYSQQEIDAARAAGRQEAEQAFAAERGALAASRAAQARAGVESQVRGLVDAGRLTPAQSAGLTEFALSLGEEATLTFSRGDGTTATAAPRDWLFGFLGGLPAQPHHGGALAGEGGGEGRPDPTDARAIREAALEYQATARAAGRVVSDAAAVAAVTRGAR